jgi:hypothetical protein
MKVSEMFQSRFVAPGEIERAFRAKCLVVTEEEVYSKYHEGKQRIFALWLDGAKRGIVLKRALANDLAKLWGDSTDEWVGKGAVFYTQAVQRGFQFRAKAVNGNGVVG